MPRGQVMKKFGRSNKGKGHDMNQTVAKEGGSRMVSRLEDSKAKQAPGPFGAKLTCTFPPYVWRRRQF